MNFNKFKAESRGWVLWSARGQQQPVRLKAVWSAEAVAPIFCLLRVNQVVSPGRVNDEVCLTFVGITRSLFWRKVQTEP